MGRYTDARVDELVEVVEGLFRAHVDGVFSVAHRVLWNRADAEDVVQNTFLRAAGHLDQLHDRGRARAWLLQIAYRESIAVLRRRRDVCTDPVSLPDLASPTPGPEDTTMARELTRLLARSFARMKPDERLAVVLRDVEQLPMRDVAGVMGVGLSAAKMRVHRGRASLRALLDPEVLGAM